MSTVITGASSVEQVKENMSAVDIVEKPNPELVNTIDDIPSNKPKKKRIFLAKEKKPRQI